MANVKNGKKVIRRRREKKNEYAPGPFRRSSFRDGGG